MCELKVPFDWNSVWACLQHVISSFDSFPFLQEFWIFLSEFTVSSISHPQHAKYNLSINKINLNLNKTHLWVWISTNHIVILSGQTMMIWAASRQNQQNDLYAQRRLRSAWASAQSNKRLRCPHEETFDPQLPTECISDQSWRMPRLIWVFAGRTYHFCWFCHEAAQLEWEPYYRNAIIWDRWF